MPLRWQPRHLSRPPLLPPPSAALSCLSSSNRRRADWGDAAEVAANVSAVKEGIYQELTEGGIAAFPGVPALVEQVRGPARLMVAVATVACRHLCICPRPGPYQYVSISWPGDQLRDSLREQAALLAINPNHLLTPPTPHLTSPGRLRLWAWAWRWPAAAALKRLHTT